MLVSPHENQVITHVCVYHFKRVCVCLCINLLLLSVLQERCSQKSCWRDCDRWRFIPPRQDSTRWTHLDFTCRSHLGAGLLHPYTCWSVLWRGAALQAAHQCRAKLRWRWWVEKGVETRGMSPPALQDSSVPRREQKSFASYLGLLAVYFELIGLSHLVIWDSEGVNFALGMFDGP